MGEGGNVNHAPSLVERYTEAMTATNLMVLPNRRMPVDTLIAAGWCGGSLGAMLYRLACEHDDIRARIRQQRRNEADRSDRRAHLRHAIRAAKRAQERAEAIALVDGQDSADRLLADAERTSIRQRLRSLPQVLEAIVGRAHLEAAAVGVQDVSAESCQHIAEKALSLWLDPLCPHCHSTKRLGGYNVEQVECRPCFSTGRRSTQMHNTPQGQRLGVEVLAYIDSTATAARRDMAVYLRHESRAEAAHARVERAKLIARL